MNPTQFQTFLQLDISCTPGKILSVKPIEHPFSSLEGRKNGKRSTGSEGLTTQANLTSGIDLLDHDRVMRRLAHLDEETHQRSYVSNFLPARPGKPCLVRDGPENILNRVQRMTKTFVFSTE
ncbi:hypothetical protein LTR86_000324 [Recurvomyces mirabilis]|nr:hypothetical protein LTR86_000324 [Recurvomyces mirabilis]